MFRSNARARVPPSLVGGSRVASLHDRSDRPVSEADDGVVEGVAVSQDTVRGGSTVGQEGAVAADGQGLLGVGDAVGVHEGKEESPGGMIGVGTGGGGDPPRRCCRRANRAVCAVPAPVAAAATRMA